MKIKERKQLAHKQIQAYIDYLKMLPKNERVQEYKNCTYYIIDFCLTLELITYDEYRQYMLICIELCETK